MTAMLTGCLTIYVALIGYRLILGQRYTVREAVLACVRVGLILTFCTRWPSYDAVFYRTVIDGPQEIAGRTLQSAGVPHLTGTEIAERVEQDYETTQAGAVKQRAQLAQAAQPASGGGQAQPVNPAPSPVTASATTATTEYTAAGLVFLISTIGSLMAVRLAAALLLAIGPLVILLALFDSLIGLLENWVAAIAATMIASVGVVIVTELELGFLEARLSQANVNGDPALTDPGLLLTATMFSLCIVGVVIAAGLVGKRLKFSRLLWRSHGDEAQAVRSFGPALGAIHVREAGASAASPSRATVVANAVSAEGQRERLRLGAPSAALLNSSGGQTTSRNDIIAGGGPASTGLGYSLRRTVGASRSMSYTRRGQRQ